MGTALEALLRAMATEFATFRDRNYMITFEGVRFEWTRWTNQGDILIEFSVGQVLPQANPEDRPRHEVIDEYVDAVVGASVPEELRAEFGGFLRGLIMQFGLLKKHNNLSLRGMTFERPAWLGDRVLKIAVKHDGRPFVPGLVRID